MSGLGPKRSRSGLRLIVALALAGAAAGGVYLYTGSLQRAAAQQPAQQTAVDPTSAGRPPVVVAKGNVPAKTPLSDNMFDLRQLPTEAVPSNAVTSLAALSGKVLNSPMSADQQLLTTMLVDPSTTDAKSLADMVPTGLRAMSLKFTEEDGAGGLIVPGNYVDVIGIFKKDALGKDESMIMLQDVQVLAVAQNTSPDQLPVQGQDTSNSTSAKPATPDQNAAPAQTTSGPSLPIATPAPVGSSKPLPVTPPQARTVTVAVAPEAAERLALAEANGNLQYIIRPTGDRSQNSVVPADLGTLASPLAAPSAQIIASEISPTNVHVGDTITVSVTVKNTSDKPLTTMQPAPGYTYVQGQTYYSQGFNGQDGTWRVAVGTDGTAGLDSTELPYRWGLGGDLAPGATTTVTGQIKLTSDFKPTNFRAALVQEPANIVQDGAGITLVTSLPENEAVIAVDAANVRSSPTVASSVVTKLQYGTHVQIVDQSADWFKVKMPDQADPIGWVAAGWIITPGS
jgi:pilus assembly protein CpaB